MKPNLKPYLAVLGRLRYCVRQERQLTPDDMITQDRIYAQALADFDPTIVDAACDEWSRTKQFWPELKELLSLCREHERLAEVARRPRLAAPEGHDSSRPRRPYRSDAVLLAMWAENDRLGAEMAARPTRFVAGKELAVAYARFEARRRVEYPELAERYYSERRAAE